ncbi:SPG16 protein, partial [Amia calva]|nr:SPG16 protein [Amia calva]
MAAPAEQTRQGPYYLDKVSIAEESEDDYQYEEVPADDQWSLTEGEENLEAAVKAMCEQTGDMLTVAQGPTSARQLLSHKPEVVDDFIRNFLIKMGMGKTMDCFQTECTHNQLLDNEIRSVQRERDNYRQAAFRAAETLVKLQKERDFHRMQHKRVVQEKNRLIEDIRRLKKHYASYEPTVRQLNDKCQAALKQKMLVSLERDRAVSQITGLEATLRNLQSGREVPPQGAPSSQWPAREGSVPHRRPKCSPDREPRQHVEGVAPYDPAKDPTKHTASKHPRDSEFPVDTRVNPYLSHAKGQSAHVSKASGFRLTNSLKASDLPVSSLAMHPRKQIIVTASDDRLWKMWGFPNGEIIMTGEGHSDWLSGCCFHPDGSKLATSSGDTTVRVWDFSKAECMLTLEGHTHAVWGCSFHSCGDFVASCSMDNTSKVWDLNSQRCRFTLHGHVDSVNSITFLPFSNTLLTSSADKTLSLWDARTGLCGQTFYGHLHSCNHAAFNLLGDTIVSCDSYGGVKLWDVRKVAVMLSVDTGPHPANQATFSPSGRTVAIASNDGSVKLLDLASSEVSSLVGHEDAVQSVIFDHKGEYLLSGGSDGKMLIWS